MGWILARMSSPNLEGRTFEELRIIGEVRETNLLLSDNEMLAASDIRLILNCIVAGDVVVLLHSSTIRQKLL